MPNVLLMPMPTTVFAGRHPSFSPKLLREMALIPKSRLGGDFRKELVCRFQQLPGGVQADGRDVVPGRYVKRTGELRPEVHG